MKNRIIVVVALTLVSSAACKKQNATSPIKIDGSSTVFPITEAVAEEFQKASGAKVTIGVSGTGGGFKKFCAGETAVSNASRPIKSVEIELCAKNGVDFIELPIAYDGLAIMVNPKNTWVQSITAAELKRMWEPSAQAKVTKWSQIRETWPDKEFHLYGPGVDSGTYDYFTEAIVHKEHASRGDYTSSEDDNVLVQGIANDESALGFFSYGYYIENKAKLKLVAVDDENPTNGAGAIAPSVDTIRNGTYHPLARPIFIYVANKALNRPEVAAFTKFYLADGPKFVTELGYVQLPAGEYTRAQRRVDARQVGTQFIKKVETAANPKELGK